VLSFVVLSFVVLSSVVLSFVDSFTNVCSVKFVGLFVALFIGISTAYDLWKIVTDRTNSIVSSNTDYSITFAD